MWQLGKSFLSGFSATCILAGGFVLYTDQMRERRMIKKFKRGNLLPPFGSQCGNTEYFNRVGLEKTLREIFRPTFSNSYYMITGDVGCGKTRLIIKTVQDLMSTEGKENKGAPIYVLASQRKSFPDTLAEAVDFRFDEHINISYFLDWLLNIKAIPQQSHDEKLNRVLAAIELSAYNYLQQTGQPVVLIIDGTNWLVKQAPEALNQIEQKAKLWADTNIVKIIFVSNTVELEGIFAKSAPGWSRAGKPIHVGDLTKEEAKSYLLQQKYMAGDHIVDIKMPPDYADRVVDLVGGRIDDLLSFKRDFMQNVPLEETSEFLKSKERFKLAEVSKKPKAIQALAELRKKSSVPYNKFVETYSEDIVALLIINNLVKVEKRLHDSFVVFESRLTECVVQEQSN